MLLTDKIVFFGNIARIGYIYLNLPLHNKDRRYIVIFLKECLERIFNLHHRKLIEFGGKINQVGSPVKQCVNIQGWLFSVFNPLPCFKIILIALVGRIVFMLLYDALKFSADFVFHSYFFSGSNVSVIT